MPVSSIPQILIRIFGYLVVVFIFFSYPIALIPASVAGASYYLELSGLYVLTIFSLVLIASIKFSISRYQFYCLIIYVSFIIFHFFNQIDQSKLVINFLGYLIIPIAFCVYCQWRNIPAYKFDQIGGIFWSVLTFYGAVNLLQGHEVIGITGNRNWMAICLLSSTPWAIRFFAEFFRNRLECRRSCLALVILIILIPTTVLLFYCQSRAAWLALILYLLWRCFIKINALKRLMMVLTFLIIFVLTVVFFRPFWLKTINEDIRIPTWKSTLKLISDHPMIGAGPGNYNKLHAPYRSESDYYLRDVATDLTLHPHNEFLNLAANLGVGAALAWLVFLIPLIKDFRRESITLQMAQFSAFVLYLHGMLDKPLVQPPAQILALCGLGLCLTPSLNVAGCYSWVNRSDKFMKIIYGLLFSGILILVLITIKKDIVWGWNYRLAAVYANYREYENSLHYYQRMIDIAPHDIRGYYGAGTIALQKLFRPDWAIHYLEHAAVIDENFAHLNRLLGKAHGTLKEYSQAQFFFERENKLYPNDILAHQNLLFATAKAGDDTRFSEVDQLLKSLYLERTKRKLTINGAVTLAKQLDNSLANEDMAESINLAKKLCQSFDHLILDPFAGEILDSNLWPVEYLYADFNADDARYWLEVVFREQILAEIFRDYDPLNLSSLSPQYIYEYLKRNIAINLSHNDYESPMNIWKSKEGSSLSFCALYAWLNRRLGCITLILPLSSASPTYIPLTLENDHLVCYSFAEKLSIKFPFTDLQIDTDKNYHSKTQQSNQDIIQSILIKSKLFFFPQEFLLKNQILSLLSTQLNPTISYDFATLPARELLAIKSLFETLGYPVNFNQMVIRESLDIKPDNRHNEPQ